MPRASARWMRATASSSPCTLLVYVFEIPMLMLSTSRDPVVPGFHQESYLHRVAAAGQSDWLVQRTVDRYGHCNFTPPELAAAFADLVAWVEFGIKPLP